MEQGVLPPLAAWASFYVIVGSSAGALTGLQFVVIALGAETSALTRTAMRAFGTPTIVHFFATLLISAALSVPWRALANAAICLGAIGTAGLAYLSRVLWHTRRQTDYIPEFEDWLWHLMLPALAYAAIFAGAVFVSSRASTGLLIVGAAALLLLSIGIHNAWDAVTYIALERVRKTRG